mmetsp:Transcript_27291/g.64111  ORF Transcript_27291/g.64111 Transcript_27291/m.64111 type:complete len:392 (-) Transcript_27291:167-1342(-)
MPVRYWHFFQLGPGISLAATYDHQDGRRLQLDQMLENLKNAPAGGHLNNHWHVGDRKEGFMEGSIHLAQKSLSSPIPAEMFDGVQCVLEMRHNRYSAHGDIFFRDSISFKLKLGYLSGHEIMVRRLLIPPRMYVHVGYHGHLRNFQPMPAAKRCHQLRSQKMSVDHNIWLGFAHKLHKIEQEALCNAALKCVAASEGVVDIVRTIKEKADKQSAQISAHCLSSNQTQVPVFVEINQGAISIRGLHEIHHTHFHRLVQPAQSRSQGLRGPGVARANRRMADQYLLHLATASRVLIVHGRVDQSSILSNLAECDCHMDYCGEDFGDEKRQHQEHHPEQDLRCVELPPCLPCPQPEDLDEAEGGSYHQEHCKDSSQSTPAIVHVRAMACSILSR